MTALNIREELLGAIAISAPTLDKVLTELGIDPYLPVATVRRWINNGPRWDRLLKDTVATDRPT